MIALLAILASGALVLGVQSAQGQSGALDPTFGERGVATVKVQDGGPLSAVIVQGDGKVIASGHTTPCHPNCETVLTTARFLADGRLDSTFGQKGIATTAVGKYARTAGAVLQPDDNIVAAGSAQVGSESLNMQFALVRYTSDGGLDHSFGSNGIVTTSIGTGESALAFAVALQPDGKIIVGGETYDPFAINQQAVLARYESDGSLDESFGTNGLVRTAISGYAAISSLTLRLDGKIVAGGAGNLVLAQYNPDGSLDPTFGRRGLVTTPPGSDTISTTDLALQQGGQILAAYEDGDLKCYKADGSADTSFGLGGVVHNSVGAAALALRPDDKIIAAGGLRRDRDSAPSGFELERLDRNGSLDRGFGADGVVVTPTQGLSASAEALALGPDGDIVAAGYGSATGSSAFPWVIARYLDQGFVLHVSISGTGTGHVANTDGQALVGLISCPERCSAAIAAGADVALISTAGKGSQFSGWGGACSGRNRCTVEMTRDRSVTAHFEMCVVPRVKGKRLSKAKRAIKHAHCAVGRITRVFSDRVGRGRVIRQRPPAGSRRAFGYKVKLRVSRGMHR